MDKTLVIGIGTGRSGTTSLAQLLDMQPNSKIYHEHSPLLPWIIDKQLLRFKLDSFLKLDYELVGDVGMYYLPYVPFILKEYPKVKMVYMERDLQGTLNSFLKKTKNKNHWNYHMGEEYNLDPEWDPCFPKYETKTKEEAVENYIRDYHIRANDLISSYPNSIYKLRMEDLSNEEELKRMLTFCGYQPSEIKTEIVHTNQGKKPLSLKQRVIRRLKRILRTQ